MNWTQEDLEAYQTRAQKWKKQPGYVPLIAHSEGFNGKKVSKEGENKESSLQGKIERYCKSKGYPLFHDRSRGVNEPGWPDCFIYLPEGRHVLIELKSRSGSVSKEQKQKHLQLLKLGHEVHRDVRTYKRFLEIMAGEK